MCAEKIRCNLLFRRFAGHRFRAAFGKFGNFPILIWAWPSAALANEPVFLINLEPCSNPADETGLAHRDLYALRYRRNSPSNVMRLAQVRAFVAACGLRAGSLGAR